MPTREEIMAAFNSAVDQDDSVYLSAPDISASANADTGGASIGVEQYVTASAEPSHTKSIEEVQTEYNQTPFHRSAGERIRVIGAGGRQVPITDTRYGEWPMPFYTAFGAAARAGAYFQYPFAKLMGRQDVIDQNRQVVRDLSAYHQELAQDSILGETAGPLIQSATETIGAATLAAGGGGNPIAVSSFYAFEGANRSYLEAKESGASDEDASWAGTRGFLVDGGTSLLGIKLARVMGFSPGKSFTPSVARAAKIAAERSGLRHVLGSAMLDGGVNSVQGGLSYLNSVYSGTIEEFDLADFGKAIGKEFLFGMATGSITSGVEVVSGAHAKFKKDMKTALKATTDANHFHETASPENVNKALQAMTAKDFQEATGIKYTKPGDREAFQAELHDLNELVTEIEKKGGQRAKSLDVEETKLKDLYTEQAQYETAAKDTKEQLKGNAPESSASEKPQFVPMKKMSPTAEQKKFLKIGDVESAKSIGDLPFNAISNYTNNGNVRLNAALRGLPDHALTPKLGDMLKNLRRELNFLPDFEGKVFRGVGEMTEADTRTFLEQFKPGKIVSDKGFLSTSAREGAANEFAGSGGVLFEIQGKTGKNISDVSYRQGESEVLFKNNTKFEVVSVEELGGKSQEDLTDIFDIFNEPSTKITLREVTEGKPSTVIFDLPSKAEKPSKAFVAQSGSKQAALAEMEDAAKSLKGQIEQQRDLVSRKKRAIDNEDLAAQRVFLQNEVARLQKEKANTAEPETATDVVASQVPQPRQPIKARDAYRNIDASRDRLMSLTDQFESQGVVKADDVRDMISKFGGNKAEELNALLDAGSPEKALKGIARSVDRAELNVAKAEYKDLVEMSKNLASGFREPAAKVKKEVNKRSAESLRDASDKLREYIHQSRIKDKFLEVSTNKFQKDSGDMIKAQAEQARALRMKSDDPLRKLLNKMTGKKMLPGTEFNRDWWSFTSPFLRERSMRPEVQMERISGELTEQVWNKIGVLSKADYDAYTREDVEGLSSLFDQLGLSHDTSLDATLSSKLPEGAGAIAQVHKLERWRIGRQDISGVDLSRDEALGLVLLAKDNQNARVMKKAGFTFDDGRHLKLDEATANQLEDFIGDEGKAIADHMFKYLNGPTIDRANATSVKLTGRPITDRKNTVPRNVENTWDILGKDPLKSLQDATVTGYKHLRKREGTDKPLTWPKQTTGGIDYFLSHTDRMNRYAAYSPSARDAQLLLTRPDVKHTIMSKEGAEGYENITEAIRSEVIGPRHLSADESAIRLWNGLNAGGIIAMRLSTLLKQGMSTIASSAYVPDGFREFTRTAIPSFLSRENLRHMEEILGKYSGYFWRRYQSGHYLGEATAGVYKHRGWFRPQQLGSHGNRLLQDIERSLNSAWRFMVATRQADKAGLKRGSDDWGRHVAREWERMTYRGENTSHGMELSGFIRLGRDNPAIGTLMTFQNTASKMFSLLPRAIDQASRGQYNNAIQTASAFVAATLPVAILNKAMSFEKSKDPFGEALKDRAIQDVFALHPFGGNTANYLYRRLKGLPTYDNQTALVGTLGDIMINVANFGVDLTRQAEGHRKKKDYFHHLVDTGGSLATLMGLPFSGPADFQKRLKAGTLFPGLQAQKGFDFEKWVQALSEIPGNAEEK